MSPSGEMISKNNNEQMKFPLPAKQTVIRYNYSRTAAKADISFISRVENHEQPQEEEETEDEDQDKVPSEVNANGNATNK